MPAKVTAIGKRCTACGRRYPPSAEHFYPSRKAKDGLQSRCKTCEAERDRRPRRRAGPPKHCEDCYGMSWNRPVEGGCPGCHLPYEAEPKPVQPTHRF